MKNAKVLRMSLNSGYLLRGGVETNARTTVVCTAYVRVSFYVVNKYNV